MTSQEFKMMTVEQTDKWLAEQLEKARVYRQEMGKEPMTSLEESALRERLYRTRCR